MTRLGIVGPGVGVISMDGVAMCGLGMDRLGMDGQAWVDHGWSGWAEQIWYGMHVERCMAGLGEAEMGSVCPR